MIIRFGSNLLMTRLLAPEMFGVMAIASTVLFGLVMFSDMGLRQNVVQSERGNDALYLNTVWTIQIVRGGGLFLVGALVGVILLALTGAQLLPASSVYAVPVLPYVVVGASASAIIQGFESTKLFEASRKLALGPIIVVDILSQIGGFLGMLLWALVDRSIWALVAGSLLSSAFRTVLSHIYLSGHRNRLHWDSAIFWEIFHFGKWIVASSVFGFLVLSGDRLILGGMVSAEILGVYVIAFLLSSTADAALSKATAEISLPAFSEIVRERPDRLKSSYYRLHAFAASSAYFSSAFLIVCGQKIVDVLYDARYAQAGWMLQMLSIGLIAVPFRMATECFVALGRPQITSFVAIVRLVTLVIATPVGFSLFGMTGAVAGIALSYLTWVPLQIYFQIKFGLFELKNELYPTVFLVLGAFAGYCFTLAVNLVHAS